jgi:hypothetical protein
VAAEPTRVDPARSVFRPGSVSYVLAVPRYGCGRLLDPVRNPPRDPNQREWVPLSAGRAMPLSCVQIKLRVPGAGVSLIGQAHPC